MDRKGTVSIPDPIAQLQRQLEEYRRTRPRRAKLPKWLWDAAAELARQHGVHAVAHPLRLDYMGLKKRLGEMANPATRRPDTPKPVFVELLPPPSAARQECLIEIESPAGGTIRIHWPAGAAPDWASLLRAWRDAGV